MVRHRKSRGFTLVELLVVIAIIAILIALLIGPISRARRQALVLACPIAARAAGQSSVLVHPHGAGELALAPPGSHQNDGPLWSTNGTWIGYTTPQDRSNGNRQYAAVVHVMTGKTRFYPFDPRYGSDLVGWSDDDHFISIAELGAPVPNGFADYVFTIREAATGRVTETYPCTFDPGPGVEVRRVPPSTGARYIMVLIQDGGATGVVLLRKDFSFKKWVYIAHKDDYVFAPAGVDPTGEYAAWTFGTGHAGGGVAVKPLNSPTTDPPFYLPDPNLLDPKFCDWTEDGSILATTWHPDSMKLMIMTRTGKLLHTVRQDKWPFEPRASYRKYMHQ